MTAKKKPETPKFAFQWDRSPESMAAKAGIIIVFAWACYWMMQPVIDMPPQRDSGCFLYIGQNWLKGMVPYRDMWDHKGPMLYVLNALGILFNSFKGVMIFSAFLSAIGFYYMLRTFNLYVHLLAAFAMSLTGIFILFFLHESGNQTEQWGIVFQGLTLFIYWKIKDNTSADWKSWSLIGLLMACTFLLRPNQIALWLIIALFEAAMLVKKQKAFKTVAYQVLYALAGFMLPVILFSAYFLYQKAFGDLIDCLFTFNFTYIGRSDVSPLDRISDGIESIPKFWIIIVGAIVNLIIYVMYRKKMELQHKMLFLFAISWLLLEMVLSTMAGGKHLHYYVQWILPSILMLCSLLCALKLFIEDKKILMYVQVACVAVLAFIFYGEVSGERVKVMASVKSYKETSSFREQIAEKILNSTDDSDYVLEWGMVDGLNFMADRRSPSKYFYPYALDTRGYTNTKRVAEFVKDVKNKRPKYIIDASKMERFPSVVSFYRDSFYRSKPAMKGLIPANMEEFYKYVKDQYTFDGNIGFMLLFKRKD